MFIRNVNSDDRSNQSKMLVDKEINHDIAVYDVFNNIAGKCLSAFTCTFNAYFRGSNGLSVSRIAIPKLATNGWRSPLQKRWRAWRLDSSPRSWRASCTGASNATSTSTPSSCPGIHC